MIQAWDGILPKIDPKAFVHEAAVLIGRVSIGEYSSVWPNCTLRADDGDIIIGARTSIQDGSTIHLTDGWSNTHVGSDCTVGHNVILHGCVISDHVLVGMGAIILDNAKIGDHCLIGAGTVITANKEIPPRSVVLGNPGKVVKEVGERELMMIAGGVESYVAKARAWLALRA